MACHCGSTKHRSLGEHTACVEHLVERIQDLEAATAKLRNSTTVYGPPLRPPLNPVVAIDDELAKTIAGLMGAGAVVEGPQDEPAEVPWRTGQVRAFTDEPDQVFKTVDLLPGGWWLVVDDNGRTWGWDTVWPTKLIKDAP